MGEYTFCMCTWKPVCDGGIHLLHVHMEACVWWENTLACVCTWRPVCGGGIHLPACAHRSLVWWGIHLLRVHIEVCVQWGNTLVACAHGGLCVVGEYTCLDVHMKACV